MNKQEFLNLINSNILKYGYHVTIVNNDSVPRYSYTIGLTKVLGYELVFAGGYSFMKDELLSIFKEVKSSIERLENDFSTEFEVKNLGKFTLRECIRPWKEIMILGVYDYYSIDQVKAYQVCPEISRSTLEIPDMTLSLSDPSNLVWNGLIEDWNLPIPKDSKVITNMDALRGKKITEVMRWENNEWEMFAGPGPEVQKEDIRVVPLEIVLALDSTLKDTLDLELGKGLWRDYSNLKWIPWN